jgi:isopentenyl diphosphate isomerase/L-lactate dehydrogenase-like FMN-dependent dehydrogenase
MTSDTVEDVTKARGAPIWMQLYATNKWEVAAAITKRAENAGCTALAVTVDRSGGRNQETLAGCGLRHPRLQRLPRPHQPAIEPEDPRDVERTSI